MTSRKWSLVLSLTTLATASHAQPGCEQWYRDGGMLGAPNGMVYAHATWDPDGGGPIAPRVVMGGNFTGTGSLAANNIVAYDPQTNNWYALGNGLPAPVGNVAASTDGRLVASTRGTLRAIYEWNGTTWTQIAVVSTGVQTNAIPALAFHPQTGDLYVGGVFTAIAGVPASNIARWDSVAWHPLGDGLNAGVSAIDFLPTGNVVVGGSFSNAGNVTGRNFIAGWNGDNWFSITVSPALQVSELCVLPGGDVVIGTYWTDLWDFFPVVQRRSGGGWVTVASSGGTGNINVITPLSENEYLFGGYFSINIAGNLRREVVRVTGSSLTALAPSPGIEPVYAMTALPSGDVIASGFYGMKRWNGSSWSNLALAGTDGSVVALTPVAGDEYVAAGTFARVGGVPIVGVARFNGTAWNAMGSGLGYEVYSLATMPNGDVIAGGAFTTPARYVARWNGATWSAFGPDLGTAAGTSVNQVRALRNGEVLIAGSLGNLNASVAVGNGTTWRILGEIAAAPVQSVSEGPSGAIYAVGNFRGATGSYLSSNVARWTGTAWTSVGDGLPLSAKTVLALSDGRIAISTNRQNFGDVPGVIFVRDTATNVWSEIPGYPAPSATYSVKSLLELPDGRLVADGFAWDGASWQPVAPGTPSGWSVNTQMVTGRGDYVVAGPFSIVDAQPGVAIARYRLRCCDSIDFNNNGILPEDDDIVAYFSVLAGSECSTCSDIDFNNNGVFPEDQDVFDFLMVIAGGPCS